MIIRLSHSIKVRIKISKKENIAVLIILRFKRKTNWFWWNNIPKRHYEIDVYDFWDPFGMHEKGGIFEGKGMNYGTNLYYIQEAWKPKHFDLISRIKDIYKEICEDERITEKAYSDLHHEINNKLKSYKYGTKC